MSLLNRGSLILSFAAALCGGCGTPAGEDNVIAAEPRALVLLFPDLAVNVVAVSTLPTYGGLQAKVTFQIENKGTGSATGVTLAKTVVAESGGIDSTTQASESVGSLAPGESITRTINCPGAPMDFTTCRLAKLRATSAIYEPDLSDNTADWSTWSCPSQSWTVDCMPGPFMPDICTSQTEKSKWFREHCDITFVY